MPSLALPLNLIPTPSKLGENDKEKNPAPSTKQTKPSTIVATDISSPHELTAFVSASPTFCYQ
jgi:heat shock factor-binding protein 1